MMQGYVAIFSVLIVSAMLTLLVFSTSTDMIFARLSDMDEENKIRSYEEASSCAYEALYALAEDSTYAGNGVITVGAHSDGTLETCLIGSVSRDGSEYRFQTSGSDQNSYTTFSITASTHSSNGVLSIDSWNEVSGIPP